MFEVHLRVRKAFDASQESIAGLLEGLNTAVAVSLGECLSEDSRNEKQQRARQRRRTSARTASRFCAIFAITPHGAPVSSCRAPQMSNSKSTGAKSIPFSVSRKLT